MYWASSLKKNIQEVLAAATQTFLVQYRPTRKNTFFELGAKPHIFSNTKHRLWNEMYNGAGR